MNLFLSMNMYDVRNSHCVESYPLFAFKENIINIMSVYLFNTIEEKLCAQLTFC